MDHFDQLKADGLYDDSFIDKSLCQNNEILFQNNEMLSQNNEMLSQNNEITMSK